MSEYQIVGPFQSHRVIVDGRRVPFLEALPVNGGKISLLLDGRYALDVSVADAEAFIPWIADAIAAASYGGVLRRWRGLGCGPRARPGLVVLPGAGEPRPGPGRGGAGKGF
jgi:hypothetical protein